MKIKNQKVTKYLLTPLVPLTTLAPLALAVSCGGGTKAWKGFDWNNVGVVQKDLTIPNADISAFKQFIAANSSKYNLLTTTNIDKINPEIVRKYMTTEIDVNSDECKILSQISAAITEFAFKNNTNNAASLKGMLDFTNNEALNTYSISSDGRGPWRSDIARGSATYNRNDLVSFRQISGGSNISLVDSSFTTAGANADSSRVWRDYNLISSSQKGLRLFDNSFSGMTSPSSTAGSATNFPLFRTKVTGDDVTSTDPQTGDSVFDQSQVRTGTLSEGLQLAVGSAVATTPITGTVDINNTGLKTALEAPGNDRLVFKVNGTQNYAKVDGGGNIVDSGIALKAKDFFYGFVRGLYSSKDLREHGTINGQTYSGLPAFTSSELSTFKSQFASGVYDSWDNKNMYLLNLYGVDVQKTLDANKSNIANNNDEFAVIFDRPVSQALDPKVMNFFLDTTIASPVPSSIIDTRAGGASDNQPATKWGLNTYGLETINDSVTTTNDTYSVAPYLYTKYDIKESSGQVVEKRNPFYNKGTPVITNAIERYETQIPASKQDPSAYAAQRGDNFLNNAATTHEYMLDIAASKDTTILNKVRFAGYEKFIKPNRNAVMGQYMSWNPYSSTLEGSNFNDIGKKMLWGQGDSNQINNSAAALDYYFNEGAKVRAAINSAINWYTVAQLFFPRQSREFYGGFVQEETLAYSGLQDTDGAPAFLDSVTDMKDIYRNNQGNAQQSLLTSKTKAAADILDEIATSAGATASHPAKIALARYSVSDSPDSTNVADANNQILAIYNKLTPKVQFSWQKLVTWTDWRTAATANKNGVVNFTSFTKDYDGAGSLVSQYLGQFGTMAGVELVRDALV